MRERERERELIQYVELDFHKKTKEKEREKGEKKQKLMCNLRSFTYASRQRLEEAKLKRGNWEPIIFFLMYRGRSS